MALIENRKGMYASHDRKRVKNSKQLVMNVIGADENVEPAPPQPIIVVKPSVHGFG